MGDFTRRVRSGRIAGPSRRAFTPESWNREFTATQARDASDEDIRVAGLAIHEKLQAVRDVLKISASPDLSATTKLRAFAAIANYDFFVARDKTERAIEKLQKEKENEPPERYALEELSAVKLDLPGGFEWSPGEVLESLVDGIEVPVRVVLQASPNLAGNPRMNLVDWKDVGLEMNLGITYRYAEDIWNDCLWNSYKMFDHGRMKVFLPQDFDVMRAYQIGLARRFSLSTSFNMMASKFQREALASGAKLKIREVCGIERQGRRQVIKVSKPGVATRVIEDIVILRAYAAEPYYDELLEEPLDELQGQTLSALVDAWTVVSRAALVLIESLGSKHARHIGDDRAHAWLPEYAPVLQVGALIDALAVAAGIRKPEGRKLVEFFTFRGKPGQEIWSQPLVPVGPDTVVPIFAAVVSPNLRRLIDVWMRQVGVDLAKRGPAFEAHIRAVVRDATADSAMLSSHAACIDHDYTFRPSSGRDEQIDLLFTIGNTVFVAEVKCILEPTDAKGIAMHRKTVMGAAEQILRKAKSIEDNRAEFIAEAKRFGIALTDEFKVVPLIVVSTNTHVGIPALKVPVIDELILGRFLDGELEDVAFQPSDRSVQKTFKLRFYSNAAEAEERAQGYFSSPPQLKRFLDGMRNRIAPIYAVDDRDWAGKVLMLECVPGGVPIALQAIIPDPGDSDSVPASLPGGATERV